MLFRSDEDGSKITVRSKDSGEEFDLEKMEWTNAKYTLNEKTKEIEDIGPEFYQTVSMVQAVAEILHFTEESLAELEGLNGNREMKIIPMKNINDRRKAA